MTKQLTAAERLERMLAIVPWVAARPGGVTLSELSDRFQLTPTQLEECLRIVWMVGVHPYTPDALIDLTLESDHVEIRLPDYFTRPLRLTVAQAFALVAAGRSVLSAPDADPDGPLARGLDKLAAALGSDRSSVVEVELGEHTTQVATLQHAVAERRQLEIDYYTYGRDLLATRRIDPWTVQSVDGFWYLNAFCHSADAVRTFRVDRIRGIRDLGTTFVPGQQNPRIESFRPTDDDPEITLDLSPSARWVVTQYPIRSTETLVDGRLRVTLAVSATQWLERLLVRLGPDAEIVSTDPSLASCRSDAARRILRRYLK
jgi:proteasome accessory factor C